MNIEQEIGNALRTIRKSRGLSLQAMELYVHYKWTYISEIERGKRPVTLATAKVIETYLQKIDLSGKEALTLLDLRLGILGSVPFEGELRWSKELEDFVARRSDEIIDNLNVYTNPDEPWLKRLLAASRNMVIGAEMVRYSSLYGYASNYHTNLAMDLVYRMEREIKRTAEEFYNIKQTTQTPSHDVPDEQENNSN